MFGMFVSAPPPPPKTMGVDFKTRYLNLDALLKQPPSNSLSHLPL
jgi:hypothetical protein